jgi:hypothetical protein
MYFGRTDAWAGACKLTMAALSYPHTAALLFVTFVMIMGHTGTSVTASDVQGMMQVVDVNDAGSVVGTASLHNQETVQTSFLSPWTWGPPIPWWPVSFCSWDYWTTAVWQITLASKSLTCNSPVAGATGTALARLASRTIASNARIQNMLRGFAWNPVFTTPVLCANKAGQLIYTVRLQAPAAAMNQLRSTAGTQSMRTVYNAASIRTLKLSGEASWAFSPCRLSLLGGRHGLLQQRKQSSMRITMTTQDHQAYRKSYSHLLALLICQ